VVADVGAGHLALGAARDLGDEDDGDITTTARVRASGSAMASSAGEDSLARSVARFESTALDSDT
jgi:hypothetical protein